MNNEQLCEDGTEALRQARVVMSQPASATTDTFPSSTSSKSEDNAAGTKRRQLNSSSFGKVAKTNNEDEPFPRSRLPLRSGTFHRSWSHHNLLLKSERWDLPFQYNRVHFFDYERREPGIDEHLEAGGMKSTRRKGLFINVLSALRGAFNEIWERRKDYHESLNRWQRFLQHSLYAPAPRSTFGQAPVEVVFVRHCEGNHNAMKSAGMTAYPDASLTNLGVEQGLTTGAILEDIPFDYIVTSPMSRCLETCVLLTQHKKRIGEKKSCPIIICPDAREYHYASVLVGNMGSDPASLRKRFSSYRSLFDLDAVEDCADMIDFDSDNRHLNDLSVSKEIDQNREKTKRCTQVEGTDSQKHASPLTKPLPEGWCPVEAEWQFHYRCDRFRRWLGCRFPPGSKVLVISHGFLFRSAFPGEGKIHNGEFRHFYIDREGAFFSVKDALIRNIVFRETYNNIKTGCTDYAVSKDQLRVSQVNDDGSRQFRSTTANGKQRSPSDSGKKSKRQHKSEKRKNKDSTVNHLTATKMPKVPLAYIPNIRMHLDHEYLRGSINKTNQTPPNALVSSFFGASSFSRSNVLVISLECLVASQQSLQEIREACSQNGEYGVMSAPPMLVDSWFGGGAQVHRYKSFFEKLASYSFQVIIVSCIPSVYTWVLLGRMGLIPTLNLQLALMQLIKDYSGIEKLLSKYLKGDKVPGVNTGIPGRPSPYIPYLNRGITTFSNIVVCGIAGGAEATQNHHLDRSAAVQDIIETQCSRQHVSELDCFLFVDSDAAVLDRLHRIIELQWAEIHQFNGPLNHEKNSKYTFHCHNDGPLSLHEMQEILKMMLTIEEKHPVNSSISELENVIGDDEEVDTFRDLQVEGGGIAKHSGAREGTILHAGQSLNYNDSDHVLFNNAAKSGAEAAAILVNPEATDMLSSPAKVNQAPKQHFSEQGEWKNRVKFMTLDEIILFSQAVNTRRMILEKRRAVKPGAKNANTMHNWAGRSASWGFKSFFLDLSSYSLIYRSRTALPIGFKRIEAVDVDVGTSFKRMRLSGKSRVFGRTNLNLKNQSASPWNPLTGSQGVECYQDIGEQNMRHNDSTNDEVKSRSKSVPIVGTVADSATNITPEAEDKSQITPRTDILAFCVVQDIYDPQSPVWYLRPNSAAGPDRAQWMAALRTVICAAAAAESNPETTGSQPKLGLRRESSINSDDFKSGDVNVPLKFRQPIPVLSAVLRIYYSTRFSYKRKHVELRQHAVGGVLTYERDTDAGRTGNHTLWLGSNTKVELSEKKRRTDFSIESMGVGPWWIRCSSADERSAWVATIRMIISR